MIEFKNIEIKYDNFIAIKDLNLEIKEGEFFTFLGPSGCGKTTTLRNLVGFIKQSKGQILVNGNDISDMAIEKREIGIVFQSYALFPTMSVYENIAYGLKIKKLSKAEINKKVMEVAKKIDINEEQLYKNVAQLSGGQQQRVALARAIVLEPKILCLDEPLSNLDAKLRITLRQELKRLQKTLGITTLYVTHDQEEALTLSDRIAVFNEGRIEQVGTPFEIYNHSASEFVCDFIGDINRFKSSLINEINEKGNCHFDPNKDAFIRIERLLTKPQEHYIEIEATIKDFEFNGTLTKYHLESHGQSFKCIEKNDGLEFHTNQEKIALFLNPQDIMQF